MPFGIFNLTIHLATTSCILRISLQDTHHGSETSTTQQFLAAVDSEVAVISVGADNPFDHPRPEVVSRLIDRIGEKQCLSH